MVSVKKALGEGGRPCPRERCQCVQRRSGPSCILISRHNAHTVSYSSVSSLFRSLSSFAIPLIPFTSSLDPLRFSHVPSPMSSPIRRAFPLIVFPPTTMPAVSTMTFCIASAMFARQTSAMPVTISIILFSGMTAWAIQITSFILLLLLTSSLASILPIAMLVTLLSIAMVAITFNSFSRG